MRPLLVPAAVVLTLGAGPPADRDEDLLARAVMYTKEFFERFSSVVAEEHYVQQAFVVPRTTGVGTSRTIVPSAPVRRELMSDFLLVKREGTSDWLAFRDVFAVDGSPVRDRQDRLTKLFLAPTPASVDEAERIAREGARYNLGGARRTINHPLLALAFLQPRYQSRFRFKVGKGDAAVAPDARIAEYTERARPTLLRTGDDRDMPASGRVWIEEASGRVLKTELIVQGSERITTLFQHDDRLLIAVPVEMQESFVRGSTSFTGKATYGRFRKFGVEITEKIQ